MRSVEIVPLVAKTHPQPPEMDLQPSEMDLQPLEMDLQPSEMDLQPPEMDLQAPEMVSQQCLSISVANYSNIFYIYKTINK